MTKMMMMKSKMTNTKARTMRREKMRSRMRVRSKVKPTLMFWIRAATIIVVIMNMIILEAVTMDSRQEHVVRPGPREILF